MSAATMIFLCADTYEVSEHSMFMFHNYSSATFGKGGEMFDKGMMMGQITPKHSDKIEYVPFDQIQEGSHLYIINVYSYSFFSDNLDIGFSCISKKYLKDIKEGTSKIVMLFLSEGYSGSKGNYDLEIIEKWRVDAE
jgi:hypothetical protein